MHAGINNVPNAIYFRLPITTVRSPPPKKKNLRLKKLREQILVVQDERVDKHARSPQLPAEREDRQQECVVLCSSRMPQLILSEKQSLVRSLFKRPSTTISGLLLHAASGSRPLLRSPVSIYSACTSLLRVVDDLDLSQTDSIYRHGE